MASGSTGLKTHTAGDGVVVVSVKLMLLCLFASLDLQNLTWRRLEVTYTNYSFFCLVGLRNVLLHRRLFILIKFNSLQRQGEGKEDGEIDSDGGVCTLKV